jgi:hypothetical protein
MMAKKTERTEGDMSGIDDSGGLCCTGDVSAIQSTLTSVIVEVLPARSRLVHFGIILSGRKAWRYSPRPAAASLEHTSEDIVSPIPRIKRRSGAFGFAAIL